MHLIYLSLKHFFNVLKFRHAMHDLPSVSNFFLAQHFLVSFSHSTDQPTNSNIQIRIENLECFNQLISINAKSCPKPR